MNGEWTPLDLINGWVADTSDPPRFQLDGIQIHVTGSAIPTDDPEAPMARFPKDVWPPFTQEGEETVGGMVMGWRVEPDGYLFIYKHHILEFL